MKLLELTEKAGGHQFSKSSGNYYISWSPDKNRYVVRVSGHSFRVGNWSEEHDDIKLTESTYNGKTEGSPVQAAAKAVMEALNHGVSITDVRKMMQDSGIDESGPVINISKPMNTKDIHVDGSITTTGGICMASASRSGLAKTRVRATLTRK